MNEEKITSLLSGVDLESMSVFSITRFGAAKLLKEAIAQEITEHLGRVKYEHRKNANPEGYRNGYQKTKIDTPIGPIEYDRPKVANTDGFESQIHQPYVRRPEEFSAAVADMYTNGISTRKVKDSLKAVTGKKAKLGRSTISRITKKLRKEFQFWKVRSLADLDVAYLFLDAIHVGMRMGGKGKDAVLVAYGITTSGMWEVLDIDVSQSESNLSWGRFVNSLKSRGLSDPLLTISDGNSSLINAIEKYLPTSYRQRCVKHRFENIIDAVPAEHQNKVGKMIQKIFYGATSLEQAKIYVQEFIKAYKTKFPAAVNRLQEDLDQCLTFYLFPPNHWRRIRTGNKIERLNKEIRRRLKVIGRHPDELGCLTLIHQVTTKYAEKQINFLANDITKRLWQKLRTQKEEMIPQLSLDFYDRSA